MCKKNNKKTGLFLSNYKLLCSIFILCCSKKTRQSYGYGEGSKEIVAAQAQVSEGLSSSVFEISVPANIPADSSGHKVSSVSILPLLCRHGIVIEDGNTVYHLKIRALFKFYFAQKIESFHLPP